MALLLLLLLSWNRFRFFAKIYAPTAIDSVSVWPDDILNTVRWMIEKLQKVCPNVWNTWKIKEILI